MALKGNKVLLIDWDGLANLTMYFIPDGNDIDVSIFDSLVNGLPLPMQHRSMFNYQRFSFLIGTNRFLTKNSFSMYKCKPLFFSLLLILFVPPFFIQILYIKNQV